MNERPRFLADLAKEDRNLQTPRRVEAALRQRVAAARNPSLWERFRWPVVAAAAAAAAAVAFFMLLPRTPQVLPQQPLIADVTTPAPPPVQEPVRLASVAPPPAKPVRRPLPRVAAPVQERITRRFYELAYAPPELLANSRIMRVRVPRAALLSFGLPLSAYQAQDEKVAADVIYTEDGVARAIRFVETNNNQD
jgi:hypothetical protein